MRAVSFLLLILFVASPVQAGSVDDFRDSIDRDRPGGSRTHHDNGGDSDNDDDEYRHRDGDGTGARIVGAILEAMLAGDTPRENYSWGDTPYQGRYSLEEQRYAAADSELRLVATPRPGHFIGRLDSLGLFDGSAMGFGFFAKVESSYSPGLVLHHQQVMDFGASDRLGITEILLEPRIVTAQHFTMFWNIGAALYGSENGFLNGGVHLGLGFTVTPVQPLLFEARFGFQALTERTQLVDISSQIGLEVSPGIFTVVGYRGLGGTGSPLHMGTAGLQIDLGFGGRRDRSISVATIELPPKQ